VQAGERLRVTLRGQPVAVLTPVSHRPRTMEWNAFWNAVSRSAADEGLKADLDAVLTDTTDDV
jgi:antitoxin (DNA-binding transcriptional repressor) of toxin-antitoxin stability system